jgi:hypothetical protein
VLLLFKFIFNFQQAKELKELFEAEEDPNMRRICKEEWIAFLNSPRPQLVTVDSSDDENDYVNGRESAKEAVTKDREEARGKETVDTSDGENDNANDHESEEESVPIVTMIVITSLILVYKEMQITQPKRGQGPTEDREYCKRLIYILYFIFIIFFEFLTI